MSKYSCISSFHGKGLMFGIEIASSKTEDDKNQRPNSKMAAAIRNRYDFQFNRHIHMKCFLKTI